MLKLLFLDRSQKRFIYQWVRRLHSDLVTRFERHFWNLRIVAIQKAKQNKKQKETKQEIKRNKKGTKQNRTKRKHNETKQETKQKLMNFRYHEVKRTKLQQNTNPN